MPNNCKKGKKRFSEGTQEWVPRRAHTRCHREKRKRKQIKLCWRLDEVRGKGGSSTRIEEKGEGGEGVEMRGESDTGAIMESTIRGN